MYPLGRKFSDSVSLKSCLKTARELDGRKSISKKRYLCKNLGSLLIFFLRDPTVGGKNYRNVGSRKRTPKSQNNSPKVQLLYQLMNKRKICLIL